MSKLLAPSIQSALLMEQTAEPPVINMRKTGRVTRVVRETGQPSVYQNVVRITDECDPIGFLMDIVNGTVIETHVIEPDGSIKTFYESPSLKQRIHVAEKLAQMITPRMVLNKHQMTPSDPTDGARNFTQMVIHAAGNDDSKS